MGGCRCTYRNCTVKSDGKTHMFHYPVFEKIRCHQWLLNADKLEFLNLRVSQLKNRCVCQHHFKEENFMNYKKDKLTFDAIPTEDGPFCDSSKWSNKSHEATKVFPIFIEDIENDCVAFCDKKANFSVKYGDFLTNCEIMDFDDNGIQNNINLQNDNIILKTVITDCNTVEDAFARNTNNQLLNMKLPVPLKDTNTTLIQPTLMVAPYCNVNSENKTTFNLDLMTQNNSQAINTLDSRNGNNVANVKPEPKIKIISEKKIKEPITIKGSFKKVSPSITLNPPNRRISEIKDEKVKINLDLPKNAANPVEMPLDNIYVVPVEFDPAHPSNRNTEMFKNVESTIIKQTDKAEVPAESKVSLMKNKITPERMAVIRNKRNFNMKLRNIIEECLDKKDIKDKVNNKSLIKACNKKPLKNMKDSVLVQEHSLLARTPTAATNPQQSLVAVMEERMKKMENTLLNRIDQNSQRISELKTCFRSKSVGKKDTFVQTNESEESYKRFLYQEISKYLSPSSNSAIFEELFINKFTPKQMRFSPRSKRRKCS